MKISDQGLQLIKTSEGFESSAYSDSVGLKTIGFGHKILPTDNFPVNGLTYAQAVSVLEEDCAHLEFFLNSYITQHNWTLTQNQFDALMDFGFNLGAGSLHKLMSHGKDQIPTQIVLWDHAGGHVVKGLLDRRVKEKVLWLT